MDAYLTDENDVQIVDEDGTPYVIGSTDIVVVGESHYILPLDFRITPDVFGIAVSPEIYDIRQ